MFLTFHYLIHHFENSLVYSYFLDEFIEMKKGNNSITLKSSRGNQSHPLYVLKDLEDHRVNMGHAVQMDFLDVQDHRVSQDHLVQLGLQGKMVGPDHLVLKASASLAILVFQVKKCTIMSQRAKWGDIDSRCETR